MRAGTSSTKQGASRAARGAAKQGSHWMGSKAALTYGAAALAARLGFCTNGGPGQQRMPGAGTVLLALVLASTVVGCASRGSPAPVTRLNAGEVTEPALEAAPVSGASYTVAAGDTMYSIARRHGTSVEALARLNQMDDPTQLRVGQVLRVSAAAFPSPVAATLPASSAPDTAASGAAPVAPISSSAPRASDADLIRWAWPANGRVLQTFNVNTKGIDLEGKLGDPVKAAADGTVMYAGNGVRGLGNLILLGHSDGFISAYAHNQTLLVKTGDKIKQGAQIAALGQSDTTSPRLHFEIRRRGTPVNPMSYLPVR